MAMAVKSTHCCHYLTQGTEPRNESSKEDGDSKNEKWIRASDRRDVFTVHYIHVRNCQNFKNNENVT